MLYICKVLVGYPEVARPGVQEGGNVRLLSPLPSRRPSPQRSAADGDRRGAGARNNVGRLPDVEVA